MREYTLECERERERERERDRDRDREKKNERFPRSRLHIAVNEEYKLLLFSLYSLL